MKRADAINSGLTRYFPDKPCRAGHTSERYTSTGGCIACLEGHRSRIVQARNAHGMGWPDVHTQVPRDAVPLLQLLVSVLRYSGPKRGDMLAMLGSSVRTITALDPNLREVECLTVSGGRDTPRVVPPPVPQLPQEPVDNGEPADWHRDPAYQALASIPAVFRGAGAP